MIDDMFQLVLDPMYSPMTVPESKLLFWLHLNIDNKQPNGFELIYSDCNISAKANTFLGYVNLRRPYGTPLYPNKAYE